MKRRDFLSLAGLTLVNGFLPEAARALSSSSSNTLPQTSTDDPPPAFAATLAAAWRRGDGIPGDFVGMLHADWVAGQIQVKAAVAVPSRAHGLLALPDGGFVAVAVRPGKWLLRCDAMGAVVQWQQMASESEGRSLDGHVCASADGQWLYTTETQSQSSQGWISVRDARNLQKVAQWRTHGVEPHHVLPDGSGALMVANGGILRADGDKKRDLHLMDSSLVRLDAMTGERLGQWRLKDARLGIRHLAWNQSLATSGKRLLGIGLQNEHDDLMQRRNSPVLALWDGDKLITPHVPPLGAGYCGDIVAGPDGGYVLSCQRANLALQWSTKAPEDLLVIPNLQEVGAMAPWEPSTPLSQCVLLAAARGLGRWHPTQAPGFLTWPHAMALDNHWAVLRQ